MEKETQAKVRRHPTGQKKLLTPKLQVKKLTFKTHTKFNIKNTNSPSRMGREAKDTP